MDFDPGETCGCDSFEKSIPNSQENALQSLSRKNALRDHTPESNENHMIGLLFIVVGNVDEEQEPTDEMIHAQVDLLNRVYSQTESKIAEQSPPSSLLAACTKPIGIRFYIKEIIRNCILPSGQWHSFDGANTTMSRASTGGADPDRADRFINVVISNYSTDGNDPFEWNAETQAFENFTNSGFSAKPRSWAVSSPSAIESLFYQRIYVQADKVGGDEHTGQEPNHNQRYRDIGFVVPPYIWSGKTMIHEIGHLLDLGHTWGETSPQNWDASPDFHECGRDVLVSDLPENDGFFRGGIRSGQVVASTDIFRPSGNRNVCTAGDFVTANPVPWSNVMNYGDDEVRIMLTDEQRKEVMSTLAFYQTYIPLTQRASPIDLTNSSLNKVRSIGAGTRAYIGSTLVWEKIPLGEEIPNPEPVESTLSSTYWGEPIRVDSGKFKFDYYYLHFSGMHNIQDPDLKYAIEARTPTEGWYTGNYPIGGENVSESPAPPPGVPFEIRSGISVTTQPGATNTTPPFPGRIRYKLSDGTYTEWIYSP